MTATIHWNLTAKGNPQDPALLLLHGFLGSARDWAEILPSLADAHFCVCASLPGHGATLIDGDPGTLTMTEVADSLLARLLTLREGPWNILGYSMGGRLALYLAVTQPQCFQRAVIESASPGLRNEDDRAQRKEQDDRLAFRLDAANSDADWRAFLDEWYAQPIFANLAEQPDLLESLIARRINDRPAAPAAALRCLGTGAQPSLWERLPEHKTPTLVIVGARDRKYRLIAEEMSDCCPAIAIHEMAACGHNVHIENPDGYSTVLKSFLEAGK
jgi:2-succinyl-6-hydroxy-2,4-cyclohexadiene-1-carboxylate synthase